MPPHQPTRFIWLAPASSRALGNTWEAYERHVKDVLESAGGNVDLRVEGKRTLKGLDGEYEVDAYAEIKVFGGAVIKIIVECKRHTKAVDRPMVESLFSRTLSLGANKAMLFSTSGFKRGAITFARAHGIALVRLNERRAEYAANCVAEPPVEYLAHYVTGTALLPGLRALLAYEPEPPDYEPDDLPEYEPAIVCVLRSAHDVTTDHPPSLALKIHARFENGCSPPPAPQSGKTKPVDDPTGLARPLGAPRSPGRATPATPPRKRPSGAGGPGGHR